jgi:hypothetical protein
MNDSLTEAAAKSLYCSTSSASLFENFFFFTFYLILSLSFLLSLSVIPVILLTLSHPSSLSLSPSLWYFCGDKEGEQWD